MSHSSDTHKPDTPLILTPLDHLGLLRIEGLDSRKFLQGQITNDTLMINDQQLLHGAHCTAKGRMLANFDAFSFENNELYVRLYRDVLPKLQQSLAKYIVFSKAELSDESSKFNAYGLMGTKAVQVASEVLNIDLSDRRAAISADGIIALKVDEARVEIWLPQNNEQTLSVLTSKISSEGIAEQWIGADISAGQGWITEATCEEFLPQALNLDHPQINGINFKKGCYTGQEIVARMHYKGKSKRHMYHFSSSVSSDLKAGSALYNGDAKAVGQIINLVSDHSGTSLLANVKDDDLKGGVLYLDNAGQCPLSQEDMAYNIT